jgi:hypothetical protein
MKKLLIIVGALAVYLCSMAQLNYEQAVSKAVKAESDMEILEVMESHGYVLEDTFQEIGPNDKINALFTLLSE